MPDPASPDTTVGAPVNAAGAQAAWLAASEQAALLNDQLLQADENAAAAAAALVSANDEVTSASAAAAEAATVSAAAQVAVDGYVSHLESFANASFRGARLSQLSVILTASSPDDYLDSVSALDRVAGSTSALLQQARDAQAAADAAGADLQVKKAEALSAQQAAVAANDAALASKDEVAASKSAFDAQVASYQALYNQLSEQERLAALAAEEERYAAAAAAAAAANPTDPAAAALAGIPSAGSSTVAVLGVSVQAPNAAAQAAVDAALSKVGSPYVWGAAGPNAFDCSGLTSWAWRQAGVTIPRTSRSQAGLPVVPLDKLQPGDLITYYSPVSHIAMYIGNGQIVQASTASKPVYVTTIAKGGPNPVGHRVY